MSGFWLVLGEPCPASLALVCACRALAKERGLCLCVLRIAPEPAPAEIPLLAAAGAERVIRIRADLGDPNALRPVTERLAALVRERTPVTVIFENSGTLAAVGPSLAAALDCGITADCTGLRWDGELGLIQIRPAFGDWLTAENCSLTLPCLASVRPNVLRGERPRNISAEIPVETLDTERSEAHFRLLRLLRTSGDEPGLDKAELIFSGGLGMGTAESFALLHELAALTGGAVGASRAAVAAGLAPAVRQIGQTGTVVRPRVYVAFGISGAVQHLSGIVGAGTIAAVNTDPHAAIRAYSDLFICCECVGFAEQLRDALKKEKPL